MRTYCKAYRLGDVRQFEGWHDRLSEGEASLSDETICYLWDDFTVVSSPFQDAGVLFDTITPEWQEFCRATLNFAIPDDLQFAYAGKMQAGGKNT